MYVALIAVPAVVICEVLHSELTSVHAHSVKSLVNKNCNQYDASEGKYHCTCYKAFMRTSSSINNVAIEWLIEKL